MKADKKSIIKKTGLVLAIAIVFFLVTMPFRRLFQVMPVTEVRPAAALNPVCGLMFGFWGALGCALGNLAADWISGYGAVMCMLGFAVQLLYGLLPHWIWKCLKRELRLDSTANLLCYMLVILLNSFVTAVLLGVVMAVTGVGEVLSTTTLLLFFNNFVFGILLGIPILLADTKADLKKNGGSFSLNERFIMIFLFLAFLSAILIGVFELAEVSAHTTDLLSQWNRVYIYISIDLFVFSIFIVAFLHYAESNITIPLEELSRIAGEYSRSGGDEGLHTGWIITECQKYENVHGEAGVLARTFGEMAASIDSYIKNITEITAEKERIGAELNVARNIQADMLPKIFPAFPEREEFDVYAKMDPAREVGGDFYDFFLVDEDHVAIVIADVSSKGVPAALFMVIARTLIKNYAQSHLPLGDVFSVANNQLCEGNEENMFVTAWMGLLTISTGVFEYVNAGHNPQLVMYGDEYNWMDAEAGFVLAGLPDISYTSQYIQLTHGSRIFLYTDGVTEAQNEAQELFGEDALLESLKKNGKLPLQKMLAGVRADIDEFAGAAEQFDDITMLALEYK